MFPITRCQNPGTVHEADSSVFLIIGRDVVDADSPEHNPVILGTETSYIQAYLCDEHDPGYGFRENLVPDGWDLLKDETERLP